MVLDETSENAHQRRTEDPMMETPRSQTPFRHRMLSISAGEMHIVEAGPETGPAVVFLHGWPQDWHAFASIMALAAPDLHAVAIDLPGIGESRVANAPGDKHGIATMIRAVMAELGLTDATLVGHDAGGQIVFAFLTSFPDDLRRAVIMDVVIPGISPWDEVLRNPYIWHFAFHSIPRLPETLVHGKERPYFDFFFDAISGRPDAISPESRSVYAEAYSTPAALSTGFDWYRAFPEDARVNAAFATSTDRIATPLLYLRGEREGGTLATYLDGFRAGGIENVEGVLIPGSGHFAPDEQPAAVWERISSFIRS